MDNYLVYLGVAMATVMLPGPAVILTLNNSIQRGLSRTFSGIVGIALAILLVSVISATSLGVVLAKSSFAFTIIKIIGAIYLVYLDIKTFNLKSTLNAQTKLKESTFEKCFAEGFFISISNPKTIVFFMSIFPQFIDLSKAYVPQFIILASTFSVLIVVIHTAYAIFASLAKEKLSSDRGNRILNKITGSVFIGFGVGLVASSK